VRQRYGLPDVECAVFRKVPRNNNTMMIIIWNETKNTSYVYKPPPHYITDERVHNNIGYTITLENIQNISLMVYLIYYICITFPRSRRVRLQYLLRLRLVRASLIDFSRKGPPNGHNGARVALGSVPASRPLATVRDENNITTCRRRVKCFARENIIINYYIILYKYSLV